jgi:pyruvate,water dikinase
MTDLDKPWVVDSTPSERFPLYTRANVAEVAPNVAAPLFSTTVSGWRGETRWRKALIDFGVFEMDEFRPDELDIMPVFYGYLYLNVSVHRVLGVRTPGVDANAMDIAFFGENPDVPPYEPHPGDDDPKYEALVAESIHRVLQTRSLPDLDDDRLEAARIRENRPNFSSMPDEELVRFAREILDGPFRRNHEKVYPLVHESSIPVAMLHQVLSELADAPPLLQLVSGLEEIDSAEPTHALWQMSRMVRASESLSRQFDGGVSGLLDRLRNRAIM